MPELLLSSSCCTIFIIIFVILGIYLTVRNTTAKNKCMKDLSEELGLNYAPQGAIANYIFSTSEAIVSAEGMYKGYFVNIKFLEQRKSLRPGVRAILTCNTSLKGDIIIYNKNYYFGWMGKEKLVKIEDNNFNKIFDTRISDVSMDLVHHILTPQIKSMLYSVSKSYLLKLVITGNTIVYESRTTSKDKELYKKAIELLVLIAKRSEEVMGHSPSGGGHYGA